MANRRPESLQPPEQFYNETEARKYSSNSRIIQVQAELAERAYELLELPEDEPCVLLDVGCGSGLSGEVLTENGHQWIGIDISEHMIRVAKEENESEGDLLLKDMGTGLPFRAGVFDGAISISAIQWLCHSNSNDENPKQRLHFFFQSLYACLARGARAVFQLYPEGKEQCDLICQQATKAGFRGGLVVDFPESSKAKKVYLVITAGGNVQALPTALTNEEEMERIPNADRVQVQKDRHGGRARKERLIKGSRDYIEAMKERQRRQGKEVRSASKYTGRKRRH